MADSSANVSPSSTSDDANAALLSNEEAPREEESEETGGSVGGGATSNSGSEKGACCPEGSIGRVAADPSADLSGRILDLQGVSTYVTGDCPGSKPKPGVALLVAHDIFGPDSGRTKRICDQLAAELGVLVVMPDFFNGKPPLPAMESKCAIICHMLFCGGVCRLMCCNQPMRWPSLERMYVDGVLNFLREGPQNVTKIAAFGFCWGGWLSTHLAARDEVCAIASCHPSLQPAKMVGDNIDDLCREVGVPTMMLAAGNDEANVKPGGLLYTSLLEAGVKEEDLHFQEFPNMKHGWVNRGDLKDQETAQAVNEALQLVTAFVGNISSSSELAMPAIQ